MTPPLISLNDLRVTFYPHKREKVEAVKGLDLTIVKGETLGLVGESGCGKTTLSRAMLGLIPYQGEVQFSGVPIDWKQGGKELRRRLQLIFQDPFASLNPRLTVEQTLLEPLKVHQKISKMQRGEAVDRILERVGLESNSLGKYPHEFSGGQRQRIAIARALILEPEFVIADEPVSALDVSVQAQILNLLRDLKKDMGLTMLFISHDLSVVRHVADRVAVMYRGELVEVGKTEDVMSNPQHPYTKQLLAAAF